MEKGKAHDQFAWARLDLAMVIVRVLSNKEPEHIKVFCEPHQEEETWCSDVRDDISIISLQNNYTHRVFAGATKTVPQEQGQYMSQNAKLDMKNAGQSADPSALTICQESSMSRGCPS